MLVFIWVMFGCWVLFGFYVGDVVVFVGLMRVLVWVSLGLRWFLCVCFLGVNLAPMFFYLAFVWVLCGFYVGFIWIRFGF